MDAVYSPRRTGLDAILVDAARAAGADVVEGFDVSQILTDGDRVTGVQGSPRGAGHGPVTAIRAKLVIGADGKRSRVARAVEAPVYKRAPARSAGIYTHWSGLPVSAGELYSRERLAVGVWPTDDGLTLTFVGVPIGDFAAFHTDLEPNMLVVFDLSTTREN